MIFVIAFIILWLVIGLFLSLFGIPSAVTIPIGLVITAIIFGIWIYKECKKDNQKNGGRSAPPKPSVQSRPSSRKIDEEQKPKKAFGKCCPKCGCEIVLFHSDHRVECTKCHSVFQGISGLVSREAYLSLSAKQSDSSINDTAEKQPSFSERKASEEVQTSSCLSPDKPNSSLVLESNSSHNESALSAEPSQKTEVGDRKKKVTYITKKRLLHRSSIRLSGVTHENRQSHIAELSAGERLRVVACKSNPYDRYAVEIFNGRKTVGFIPASMNRPIHDAIVIDKHIFTASVKEIVGGYRYNYGLIINLYEYEEQKVPKDT